VSPIPDQAADQLAIGRVVVDNENLCHGACSAARSGAADQSPKQDFDLAREGLRPDRFREAAVKPDRKDLEWDVRHENVVHATTALFRQP
jgi:hypothetical protein